VRFIEFRSAPAQDPVSYQVVIAVGFFWGLSGLVDVILYFWAKPAFAGEILLEE